MIEDAFLCRKSINSSSGANEETNKILNYLNMQGNSFRDVKSLVISFIVEMYHLKCMYNLSDRAFDAFTKLFKSALLKDSVLLSSFKQMQSILSNLILATKR